MTVLEIILSLVYLIIIRMNYKMMKDMNKEPLSIKEHLQCWLWSLNWIWLGFEHFILMPVLDWLFKDDNNHSNEYGI
jgi:hypothetical protein